MTEKQERKMREYSAIQDEIIRILQNGDPIGSDARKKIHEHLSKYGMDTYFINPTQGRDYHTVRNSWGEDIVQMSSHMTDEQKKHMQEYIGVQDEIIRILQNEEPIGSEVRKNMHEYLSKCGIDKYFIAPEDVITFDNIEDDNEDLNVDERKFFEECLDEEKNKIAKAIASNRPSKLSNASDISLYFWGRLPLIRSASDVMQMLHDMRELKSACDSVRHRDYYSRICEVIGDLLLAIGKPEDAIAEYNESILTQQAVYSVIDALLNALETVDKNPSVEIILRSNCLTDNVDEILNNAATYLKYLIECEYTKCGGSFLTWVKKQNHYHIYNSYNWEHIASHLCRFLNVPLLICYTHAKEYMMLVDRVTADGKALLNLSKDILNISTLQDCWIKGLMFFEQVAIHFTNDTLVHHYRESWMWRYHIDVFFENRNFGIIFDAFSTLPDEDFKGGNIGKNQVLKTWKRIIRKSQTKYGITLAVLPTDIDTSNVIKVIKDCFAGKYSIRTLS